MAGKHRRPSDDWFLVFLLIGWESGASFVNQSQSEVNQNHFEIIIIIIIIMIIILALGTVKKGMVENIKKVSERATVTEVQKICMLGSARILRKVLSI